MTNERMVVYIQSLRAAADEMRRKAAALEAQATNLEKSMKAKNV